MASKTIAPCTIRSLLNGTSSPSSSLQTCLKLTLAQPSHHGPKHQRRALHHRLPRQSAPKPTAFVPDPATFLKLIGRSLSQHASKIPTWSALFNLTSPQLRDLGIEPARDRRYLLRWRDKFRRGDWGVGGDLTFVDDNGVGLVGIVDIPKKELASTNSTNVSASREATDSSATTAQKPTPTQARATMTRSPGVKRMVVNLPSNTPPSPTPTYISSSDPTVSASDDAAPLSPTDVKPVAFLKIKGSSQIYGPDVQLVKGSGGTMATVSVREGLWEQKRGHKIDGGERRRAQVRAKKRAAENKANS